MMQNDNREHMNTDARDRPVILSGEGLNRLIIHLSVVHGQVQLLRRQFDRNPTLGRDELDRALARLEGSTRALVAALPGLTAIPNGSRGGPDTV